jgi:CRISPR-associated protein Cas1
MSLHLLNTLYVQTPDAIVRLDSDALAVEIEGERKMRVPLQHLNGVVLFDRARMTAAAMARCAADGRSVTFLDYRGRFQFRIQGPTSGNVLLRVAQHAAMNDPQRSLVIARQMVAGKVRNSRAVLLRGARDLGSGEARTRVATAASTLQSLLERLPLMETLDSIRGVEGDAAKGYYEVFGQLILAPHTDFAFTLRTRRPPRDRVNALLSFVYSMLANECVAAAETVGLDPQIGFLHALRPGRPSLALDLMEELRAGWADRLVLTLINRRQIRPEHFDSCEEVGGAVQLTEDGRRVVLTEYREKAKRRVAHAILEKTIPLGMVPQVQARLLARHLRRQTVAYVPFTWA